MPTEATAPAVTPEILSHITAADAQAELDRRAIRPKSARPKAGNRWAQQLWAEQLKAIIVVDTVESEMHAAVKAQPEVVRPDVVITPDAEIIYLPVTPVNDDEPTDEDAPVAPVVPIERKRRGRKPRTTQPEQPTPESSTWDGRMRTLKPFGTEQTQPTVTMTVTDLYDALKAVESPTKTRMGILPELKCVVIEAEGSTATLTTSDLDATFQVQVSATVEQTGTVLIPLPDLLRALPTAKSKRVGDVSISVSGTEATVKVGTVNTTLETGNATAFPQLPTIGTDAGPTFTLDMDAIASVLPSAAKEETRPILTGVLFDGNVVVTTDSYRLHESDSPIMQVPTPMLVPSSFLSVLAKRGKAASAIANEFSILVTDESGLVAVSRLIDGQFPNYKTLFPAETPVRVEFDSEELIAALTGFLAGKPQPTTAVRFARTEKDGKLSLSVKDSKFEASRDIHGTSPVEVGFNPRYLRDLVTGGFNQLEGSDALKPWVAVREINGRRERRLLMPIRLDKQ